MPGKSSWTSLEDWVAALRDLHARARQGKLSPDELKHYREERDTLSKAIVAGQQLRAAPGSQMRQTLRIAREFVVHLGGERAKLKTLDLGPGGFAVMMAQPPRAGDLVKFTLELGPGTNIAGKGRIASLQRKGAAFRVAVQFVELAPEDAESVHSLVFETALAGVLPTKR